MEILYININDINKYKGDFFKTIERAKLTTPSLKNLYDRAASGDGQNAKRLDSINEFKLFEKGLDNDTSVDLKTIMGLKNEVKLTYLLMTVHTMVIVRILKGDKIIL